MADRYCVIDSGKFETKISEYIKEKNIVRTFKIRSKYSSGSFLDDAIEDLTVVVQIDGEIYKVGRGATRGTEAELETDKRSKVHQITILTALATICSSNEEDTFHIAIMQPLSEWADIEHRISFKNMMLPEGKQRIDYKKNSVAPVVEKVFTIKDRFCFPEGMGALFLDDYIEFLTPESITGVIDLGHLNGNYCLYQFGTEPILDRSLCTADQGGQMLIQNLSQRLSTSITPTDELTVQRLLSLSPEDRHLPAGLGLTDAEVEESAKIIKEELQIHAQRIKQTLRSKNWSFKTTRLIAIGGTSSALAEELSEVFEGNIIIPENANLGNALGCLRLMCSKIFGEIIDLRITDKSSESKNQEITNKEFKKAS